MQTPRFPEILHFCCRGTQKVPHRQAGFSFATLEASGILLKVRWVFVGLEELKGTLGDFCRSGLVGNRNFHQVSCGLHARHV